MSSKRSSSPTVISRPLLVLIAFVFGCITSAVIVLNFALSRQEDAITNSGLQQTNLPPPAPKSSISISKTIATDRSLLLASTTTTTNTGSGGPLQGQRILIAIAAFDFSQLPHLEEVLDAYQDLCATGASKVDIVIHATVAYPVTLIDLLNTRLIPGSHCQEIMTLKIILKSPNMRLHLVDCHRTMFYDHIDDYDLFIYTEDDIRVSPRVVAAYLIETNRLNKELGPVKASDFNVGIVRYEYNYPSNVVIDDKTRHATQNVTRVYWEHGMYPVIPKAVDAVPFEGLAKTHVHMRNHHQGMFLATADLLKAWDLKKGCEFGTVTNRPGMKNHPGQPAEGTQRVWMSSQQLYGGRHCNIQQVIPIDSFGTLTVLHLPNKNYRRVGHFRNRTFSDGTEKFDFGMQKNSNSLLTAMRLHLELRNIFPQKPQFPYRGIQMVDEVDGKRTPLLERRMGEYQAYVDRGGILSEEDMTKIDLVQEQ